MTKRIPLLINGKLRKHQPAKHVEIDGVHYKMNADGVINKKYQDVYTPIRYFRGLCFASQQEFDRLYSDLVVNGKPSDRVLKEKGITNETTKALAGWGRVNAT